MRKNRKFKKIREPSLENFKLAKRNDLQRCLALRVLSDPSQTTHYKSWNRRYPRGVRLIITFPIHNLFGKLNIHDYFKISSKVSNDRMTPLMISRIRLIYPLLPNDCSCSTKTLPYQPSRPCLEHRIITTKIITYSLAEFDGFDIIISGVFDSKISF